MTPPTRERLPSATAAAASSTSQPPVPHVPAPRRTFPRARPRPLRSRPPVRPCPWRCVPEAVPSACVCPQQHTSPPLRASHEERCVSGRAPHPLTHSLPHLSFVAAPSPLMTFPQDAPLGRLGLCQERRLPLSRPVNPPPLRRRLLKVATPATAQCGQVCGRDVFRGRPIPSPCSQRRSSRYPRPFRVLVRGNVATRTTTGR